jgi:hypothetical protein
MPGVTVYVATLIISTGSGVTVDSSQRFTTQSACELYGENLYIELQRFNITSSPVCVEAYDEVVNGWDAKSHSAAAPISVK